MLIAHDLGTTGNKATLVSNDGTMLASHTVNYGADWGTDGKAEQNPHDWFHAVAEANRILLEKSNTAAADINGISFSGQMMGLVPLDEHDEVVRPAIIWADTRSTKEAAELEKTISMEDCYRITGHRLNPTYSLTKLMWLRAQEPENFSRIKRFCLAKDYVAMRLTGRLVTDPSDASSTNAYDQSAGTWAWDIIGGGDGPVAALGAGIIDEESGAYSYLGSSSWVSLSSSKPLLDPKMRSMTFNHVIPGQFVPTATMQAGGASVSWGMDVLSGGKTYEEFLDQADGVDAALSGLFFLPYLIGERSPHWNPLARGVFAGLHMDHKQEHMMKAILEGVAFNLRVGLEAFSDAGFNVDHIDVIGGLAKSPVMCSLMANIWNIPVAPRNIVDEANAIGAAVLAGVGTGVFDDFSVAQRLSKRDTDITPDIAIHNRYEQPYRLFNDAYERLIPWFSDTYATIESNN